MKCSDTYVAGDLTAGVVLHNEAHTRQALLLGTHDYGYGQDRRHLALVFDTHTGERDLSNESEVAIKGWHIAEHYKLGMVVEADPPETPRCLHKHQELGVKEVCPCGCRSVGLACLCSYCDGGCEGTRYTGDLCSNCANHTECSCGCGCNDTTDNNDSICNWCDDTNICEECNESHDIYSGDLCHSCYSERERQEAAEEAAREEAEQERINAEADAEVDAEAS